MLQHRSLSSSRTEVHSANEVFYNSPLHDDHRPRDEVIAVYLQHAENPRKNTKWAATTVAGVTFYASLRQQWDLILELIVRAPDDEWVLQTIAAGPLEGLLGRFGDAVVDAVEQQAREDSKFARTLSGVWQHGMSDQVWSRIRAVQKTVERPLPELWPFE